ncbi:MAG: DUF4159 domain-containing protein [Gammaproteobacteria bacterium]
MRPTATAIRVGIAILSWICAGLATVSGSVVAEETRSELDVQALEAVDLTRLTLARAEYDSGELTRLTPTREPIRRRFTDPDLGDFPLLFMSDPGYMRFTKDEAEGLRNYLANGGFLWVDDFWGDAEWASFERFMRETLPGNHWREVPLDHPIFHTVFEFDEMPQIPARSFAGRSSFTAEPAWFHRYPAGSLEHPSMRGYFDAEGRLIVIGTHNTDVFDGWEREAYGTWYFERFSTQSYRMGVNVLTYVFTH